MRRPPVVPIMTEPDRAARIPRVLAVLSSLALASLSGCVDDAPYEPPPEGCGVACPEYNFTVESEAAIIARDNASFRSCSQIAHPGELQDGMPKLRVGDIDCLHFQVYYTQFGEPDGKDGFRANVSDGFRVVDEEALEARFPNETVTQWTVRIEATTPGKWWAYGDILRNGTWAAERVTSYVVVE